jgi:hypothetical protein
VPVAVQLGRALAGLRKLAFGGVEINAALAL